MCSSFSKLAAVFLVAKLWRINNTMTLERFVLHQIDPLAQAAGDATHVLLAELSPFH